jgi:tetratricopeptide (TPR) repeat protein
MKRFLFIFALQFHVLFSDQVPLFKTEGIYTHPISSKIPLAQKYFDQGMIFFYGFNYDEAARSFQEAANIDPTCAICYWGKALALRGNVTSLQDPRIPLAMKSIEQAQRLLSNATPQEQAYIKAIANSYLSNQNSLSALDQAFKFEMANLSKQYPEDLDAKTLSARAKMQGIQGGKDVLMELNEVLEKDPNHVGALHYHIHVVESNPPIEKGLPSAKKLETLVPYAGHLIHMSAHIYFNLGLFRESSEVNKKAIQADEDLFAKGGIKGKYLAGYYLHNIQFLIASLVMEGKKNEALEAAQKALKVMEEERPVVTTYTDIALRAQKVLILQRFNDWDQILKEPTVESSFGDGMLHFSKSLAYLAKNNIAQAKQEANLIQKEPVPLEEDWMNNLLKVAYLNAQAAISEKEGNLAETFSTYQKAIQLEDSLVNSDPPVWFMSSREAYGNALLRANRPKEAAEMFREDLKKHPHKMWSEEGLKKAK